MRTTLGLQMTLDDLREFAKGRSYRGEISTEGYKGYFQG